MAAANRGCIVVVPARCSRCGGEEGVQQDARPQAASERPEARKSEATEESRIDGWSLEHVIEGEQQPGNHPAEPSQEGELVLEVAPEPELLAKEVGRQRDPPEHGRKVLEAVGALEVPAGKREPVHTLDQRAEVVLVAEDRPDASTANQRTTASTTPTPSRRVAPVRWRVSRGPSPSSTVASTKVATPMRSMTPVMITAICASALLRPNAVCRGRRAVLSKT